MAAANVAAAMEMGVNPAIIGGEVVAFRAS